MKKQESRENYEKRLPSSMAAPPYGLAQIIRLLLDIRDLLTPPNPTE